MTFYKTLDINRLHDAQDIYRKMPAGHDEKGAHPTGQTPQSQMI